MTNRQYDIVIIGAGALGCAIARELSRYKIKVAVLEKNSDVAGETTGRNSAVVHAGFNNRRGSLMARFCVEGNEGFETVCRELDVPYSKTGKMLVAFDEDDAKSLAALYEQGIDNGCKGLELLEDGHKMYSPNTAITNPFLYCVALAENAYANGVDFYFDCQVNDITRAESGEKSDSCPFTVSTEKGIFGSNILINCAGLNSDRISAMAGVDKYHIYPCRGEYFILDKAELDMPVYPAPKKKAGGLGVHITPTIEGNIIIGPSADYIDDRDDYSCTRPVMDELLGQARLLMPEIAHMKPIGNYSGIRPKQAPPGEGGYHDFVIRMEEDAPGLVNLIGIESPGLTASLPIGRYVCSMIESSGLQSLYINENFDGSIRDRSGARGGIVRFREKSVSEQLELIRLDPEYGQVICRCQKITKREIRDAIENPLGVKTISAVKYRAWPTTGRCNGGYCLPKIVEMLVKEYGMKAEDIQYRNQGSEMFTGKVK